jgi:uncharacterized membrane protein YgaE (UPF0421/DUF939 family)
MQGGDALRRFERRLTLRLDVTMMSRRAIQSVPAALQIVSGVLISYSFTHFVLGHATPLIAVTVVISTLGFARDARPRKVVESAVGILVGIVLAELLRLLVGTGVWQLGLVLLVTMVVARAASPNPAFALAAATQSALVMILPIPVGGPFTRSIDGAVAGVVALLLTALVPRDTRRIAIRDGRALASLIAIRRVSQSMTSLLEGLVESNQPAAFLAVERLRKTQVLIDNWTTSLDSAIAVARIAPLLRRQLVDLRRQRALLEGFDLAARHLRVIARRLSFLIKDNNERAELVDLFSAIASIIDLMGAAIEDPAKLGEAAEALRALAPRLNPDTFVPDARVTESLFVLLCRPLVVDLLMACGYQIDDARALLPEL